MRVLFLFVFFASSVSAQPLAVTNTFSNNTVADATDINQNFADIVSGVNAKLRTDNGSPYATAVGFQALENNTGSFNTAVGLSTLYTTGEGGYNTALGANALSSNTSGHSNTASGYQSLHNNRSGYKNTASGWRALYSNVTGNKNTASGVEALNWNTTGIENTASGYSALFNNITGDDNTATGADALFSNIAGDYNVASGYRALYENVEGDLNTANGYEALFESDSDYNTANGALALRTNSLGLYNTAAGVAALYFNTEGDYNTAVGANAGVTTGNLDNTTAIGYGAQVTASNKVQIGNDLVEDVYLGRRSGTGGVANLHLLGTSYATTHASTSDERLKEDIAPVSEGLALVNDLSPVRYRRIGQAGDTIEMGLIAQEVQATLDKHGLHSGMVSQPDENGNLYLHYNELLAPMIRAIQELDDASMAKDEQIALLEQKLETQQEELLTIVQRQQEQIAQLQRMMGEQFAAR